MSYDFTIRMAYGETHECQFEIVYADDTAPDLTGAEGVYTVYDRRSRAVLFSKKASMPSASMFLWIITPSDSRRPVGSYAHDFRYSLDGVVTQVFCGDLIIDDGV